MKTRTKVEKIESVTARAEVIDLTAERKYRETINWLRLWNGDGQRLLAELQHRNRNKPKPEPIDLTDERDPGAEFCRMVNRVAERLRSAPTVREWETAEQKAKPRESETARLLRLVK